MESVEDGNEKRKLQRERKKRREERDRKKKEMGTERARIRRRGRGEEIWKTGGGGEGGGERGRKRDGREIGRRRWVGREKEIIQKADREKIYKKEEKRERG